jgi:TolB-like protein/class 3 adenylate cyclase
MTATRRLAAILAADVAGYSRLIGVDEEGTLNRLRSVRAEIVDPSIVQHRGRIVKTTGDGLLGEFSSVVDALRCASEIQKAMVEGNAGIAAEKCIEFRMGINVGDVVVEDGDIFGDGVNVAARLEALADPGGICVSARVQEDVAGKLDLTFEDLGEQTLKNIARPVRVYRVRATTKRTPTASLVEIAPTLALPDKPSIAVLPFQNMSGDPDQEYFVDGMVEEITTAISRLPCLFVIARNSSFAYKGKSPDLRQVGRELGVRYVLEGSVRKSGNRVRITGQLIDTTTGAHIWADRFDGALDDIFEMQDHVASSVVGAIEPKLRQSEIERAGRKPTESLDAYDFYLRALAQFHKLAAESHSEAVRLASQALDIDPRCAPAAALIGYIYVMQVSQGWVRLDRARLAEIRDLAKRAVQDGRDDPDTLWMAALVIGFTGDAQTALSVVERALSLNPNSAHAWMQRGYIECFLNRPEPAVEALQRAMRLSPLDPLDYYFFGGLAMAALEAGRYEEAVEWADRSLSEEETFLVSLRIKVAACGLLGKLAEGHRSLTQMLELQPGATVASFKAYFSGFFAPEVVALYAEGLRKSGMTEE